MDSLVKYAQVLEGIGTLVTAVFAFMSWWLLKKYARDTESIARVSMQQLEEANRPVLLAQRREAYANGYQIWLLENVGSGPAINIRYLKAIGRKGKPIYGRLLGLATTQKIDINLGPDEAFTDDVADAPDELIIEYSSIRGSDYRSTIGTGDSPSSKFEAISNK